MCTQETPFHRILIADDQQDVLKALRLLLKPEGFEVVEAASPAGIIAELDLREFDVLLMDLNYARDTTSGREGLDLLPRVRELDGTLPVVVMTAYGSVQVAVEAMRNGARDFVEKPWDNERLLSILRTQVELVGALRKGRRLEEENRLLREQAGVTLIAESKAMQPILRLIANVGSSDANVLITGENGTGKSLVARAVHATSRRADKPMITVNVPALSESIFESELFGHVKGAFTDAKTDRVGRFEMASKGTLFLDEIANVPPNLQPKLLRVLETGEYERVGSSKTQTADVRVVSATNADVYEEVRAGRLRQDLLYRLNTVEIALPSLRDRRDDIPLLGMHFLRRHSQRYRPAISRFDTSAVEALMEYAWPGNVRELDHVVERAVLMAQDDVIRVEDLALRPAGESAGRLEGMTLDEVEAVLIKKALARSDGNVKEAAKALGLSRSGLYRRLAKHGLAQSE
ncbi:MAG: sigma-54-dependent Fis family transcriptional regulator [Phycisphaerales bacterium]|nr:MAG: sigma-54-dependent Fis family transcriptional regulator [Phycisphaerales bacterium]